MEERGGEGVNKFDLFVAKFPLGPIHPLQNDLFV